MNSPPIQRSSEAPLNLDKRPTEILSQILREVIPERYFMTMKWAVASDQAVEYHQNPKLSLLLVNHRIFAEAASVPSVGITTFDLCRNALKAVLSCSASKRNAIQVVRFIRTLTPRRFNPREMESYQAREQSYVNSLVMKLKHKFSVVQTDEMKASWYIDHSANCCRLVFRSNIQVSEPQVVRW